MRRHVAALTAMALVVAGCGARLNIPPATHVASATVRSDLTAVVGGGSSNVEGVPGLNAGHNRDLLVELLKESRAFAAVTTSHGETTRYLDLRLETQGAIDRHFGQVIGWAILVGFTLGLAIPFMRTRVDFEESGTLTAKRSDGLTRQYMKRLVADGTAPFGGDIVVETKVVQGTHHTLLNDLVGQLVADRGFLFWGRPPGMPDPGATEGAR